MTNHSGMSNDTLNSHAITATRLQAARDISELELRLNRRIHELETLMLQRRLSEEPYPSLDGPWGLVYGTLGGFWVGWFMAAILFVH